MFFYTLNLNGLLLRPPPLTQDERVEIEANHIIHLAANKYPFKLILKTDFSPVSLSSQALKRTASGEEKTVKPRVDYNHWSHALLGESPVLNYQFT